MSKKMKYWLATLALMVIGGGVGFVVGEGVGDNLKGAETTFAEQVYLLFPYDIIFYLMAVTCLVLLVLVLSGLMRLKNYSREVADDELYSPAENAVSTLMMQSTLLVSIATVWVFAGASYMHELEQEYDFILGVLMICSVVIMAIGWLLSRKVMAKMNELVPRLAMDLYDTNANRQYNSMLQRLDESEKLQMYKAGFQAMRWMLTVLYILLFAIMIYSVLIESQMNLLLLGGFLIIINQAFYFYAVKQQTRRRK